MGRVARWFKSLFGFKKSKSRSRVSRDDDDSRTFLTDTEKEQNKQAIAVANATVTAAEAAVSAALAAAAVLKLTSEGRSEDIITREERLAVVKIQKVFRGCLARKALRALKGIVKLQALVRGYLVRKRAAAMLQRIQALIRVQTTMRSKRIKRCLDNEYNHAFQPPQPLDKFDETTKRRSSPRSKSRQVHYVAAMSGYGDDLVYKGNNDLELSFSEEKWKFATAQNTPRFSNRYYVTQSPAKSVCGNALGDYGMSTPGYMEKTQSFKAKLRSHSAPRQRSERMRLSLDDIMASSDLSMEQQQRYSCSYDPL